MRKLLVCVCGGLLSSSALAELPVNMWLEKLADRGVEIEHIRVASEKPKVAIEEADAEIDSILQEAEQLEGEPGIDEETEIPLG